MRKSFRLPHEQYHTLKERVLHPFRTSKFDILHAVDDVSLEIPKGEFFGIVGRNGSGKSTLLKCLAGIYGTDHGSLSVNGRLAPFIELGVGFNPDLTARDNAIINGIMLGLTRKQALARLDDITAFAELEEFMDLRLKNYSSGMHVRLAFSVAIQVDADILLIDEVLAVGDASFQQKCFDQFTRLKEEGRTIVFVTHDMGSVEHFCDRAMLMERGKVVDIADPPSITRQYNELNFRRVRTEATEQGGPEVLRRAPVAELLGAWFESLDGQQRFEIAHGESCQVRMEVRFHTDTEDPMFAIALRNDLGHTVFAASTQISHGPTGRFRAGQVAHVVVSFENWLSPGRYRLTASVTRDGTVADAYDLREDISSVVVHTGQSGGGTVDLPHSFAIRRT
ncbi:MAG: ABC transporter ATP-binding protein [Actinomycetota bacterium]|nr:ABC transporter ATP-binding protein [Actinomycetota bacterium]